MKLVSIITLLLTITVPCMAQAGAIRLAVVTKPGSAQNVCAEAFAQVLEHSSQGRLKVELFHSGSMGDECQILYKLRQGQLDMCVVTAGSFDRITPQVRAVEFPFLFENYAQVDRVLQGTAGRRLLASLEESGFKGLAFAENGFRNLTNSRRPIKQAADVKGLLIRVMESKLQTCLWRELGAVPVPHSWPITELLAKGQVDGQENPLGVIWHYRLDKVQKYLSLTRHVYSAHICAANPIWFHALSRFDQRIVAMAMEKAAAYQREHNRGQVAFYLSQLKTAGMEVVENPDRASFKAKTADLSATPLFDNPRVMQMLTLFKKELGL
ncbi:MAG: DctP family TRAP transporter solute-binding subunit [Desulfarculaceae bacterium]|nr:DctP family TRAP transporter solute-binding subunit [Desulfarculaceae bacterium]MCF8045899.1 DctP family TRAP transporter solute-binding subunit [Desulfarculaceae bacterium]MCF8121102.1 DctP family TRAP transporter solute-binding subunit [Desulfarculaceae bacterium]